MRWLVLLVLSGCYFYAKDVTTSRVASSEVRRVPMTGFAGAAVQATSIDGTLRVFVSAQRDCRLDFIDHIEVTHGKRFSFDIADNLGPYGAVFAVLVAPITLPISAVIAGASTSGHHDTVTYDEKITQQGREPCPQVGAQQLRIRLPSGSVLDATTGADGTLVLPVPPTEADAGVVVLQTAGAADVALYYFRTIAACATQRDAQLQEAAAYFGNERAQRLERVAHCKAMTTGFDPKREYAYELAIAAGIAASRGQCKVAFEREPDLAELDRPLHDAAFKHPDAMRCLKR